MEENKNETRTDYEPNFILKDSEPQKPEEPAASSVWQNHASETPIAENTSFVNADTIQDGGLEDIFSEEELRGAGINVEEVLGQDHRGEPEEDERFRDPRENFKAGSASGASARWSGGRARAQSDSGRSAFAFGSAGGGDTKRKLRKTHKTAKTVTMSRKALAMLIAGCMAISCVFGIGGGYIGSHLGDDLSSDVATMETTDAEDGAGAVSTTGYNLQNATGSNMSIQEITKAAQKSVVEIRTEGMVSDSWMQQYVTEGAGSGVIISKDGYIMTNNHVINGANKITVTTNDKHSYEATLIGTDPTNDVAVLKIKATGLTPAAYGNSDQLQVGDMAVAIGNPLGELGGTVTAGIISATDRELVIDGKTMKLLQTDSSINPGNSGGGLFNGDGQLIGLVVAKSSGSDVEGLGFAIPVNTAASVAQQLMDKGYVSGQPWTGMTYTEGSSGLDFLFGESSGGTVYIYSVDTKVAKEAGFKAGDVVFAIDEHQITSIDDLTSIISSHKVGDKLKYTIVRDGQTKELKITLQEKTKEQVQQSDSQTQNEQQPQENQDGQGSQNSGDWFEQIIPGLF